MSVQAPLQSVARLDQPTESGRARDLGERVDYLSDRAIEADHNALMADLRASRARLFENAQAERRRLERDLHDGIQQSLVVLRLKLDQALEVLPEDPTGGARALVDLGRRIDDVLDEVRSLARGIYPAVLQGRGLEDALRSAADRSPVPTVVRALAIGRYDQSAEVAVYFCCLEALQNVAKHGGPGATATLTLWEDHGRLCFEVSDSGAGFDSGNGRSGSGLTNMRDRIQAVDGRVTVASHRGGPTRVRGWLPIA